MAANQEIEQMPEQGPEDEVAETRFRASLNHAIRDTGPQVTLPPQPRPTEVLPSQPTYANRPARVLRFVP